jgi:hypothetical protein
MKLQSSLSQKYNWIVICLGVITALLIFSSCTDTCTNTTSYTYYEPILKTTEEIRAAVQVTEARSIVGMGKIYTYGDFLLINEPNKGVHIINNSNPSDPEPISFVNIPGNFDMAVRNNTLYADSYIDLLIFDISNPEIVSFSNRIENAFPLYNNRFGYTPSEGTVITEMKAVDVRDVSHDCQNNAPNLMFMEGDLVAFQGSVNSAMNVSAGPTLGTGGSMARFAIVDKYLYAVDDYDLNVFDLENPDLPEIKSAQNIGWGIETIFPYKSNLFIGSRNGMFVYGLENPELPTYQSQVNHVTTCDPVVANDDYAFVTLRAENNDSWCGDAFTNQLDVIDISDVNNARILKSFDMSSPHGLGLDGNLLFITEGAQGLKIFDISDVFSIDEQLIYHETDYHAIDVIPNNGLLLMIGDNGIYQFDYSDPENLSLLSILPIYDAL